MTKRFQMVVQADFHGWLKEEDVATLEDLRFKVAQAVVATGGRVVGVEITEAEVVSPSGERSALEDVR